MSKKSQEDKPKPNVYRQRKGYENSIKISKTQREKFMTVEEVEKILAAVKAAKKEKMHRDYCAIFLGFYFGLRIGEVGLLTRQSFRDLDQGVVYVRRLKSSDRIPYVCYSCGRRRRVRAERSGKDFACPACGKMNTVPVPRKAPHQGSKEKVLPLVETEVSEYVKQYMAECMRPNQEHLIEGFEGYPLSTQALSIIFSTYLEKAGLNNRYSWHALRHGRGVFVLERFNDLIMVRDMLGHSSIKTAEIYAHMSPERIAVAKQALESGKTVKATAFLK